MRPDDRRFESLRTHYFALHRERPVGAVRAESYFFDGERPGTGSTRRRIGKQRLRSRPCDGSYSTICSSKAWELDPATIPDSSRGIRGRIASPGSRGSSGRQTGHDWCEVDGLGIEACFPPVLDIEDGPSLIPHLRSRNAFVESTASCSGALRASGRTPSPFNAAADPREATPTRSCRRGASRTGGCGTTEVRRHCLTPQVRDPKRVAQVRVAFNEASHMSAGTKSSEHSDPTNFWMGAGG
jgi:hypothetical protein